MQLVNVSRLGGIYSLLNRNSIQLWNSLCVAGHEGLGGGIQMIPLAELQGREMPPCTGDARPHLSVLRNNLLVFKSIKIISTSCQCSSKVHSGFRKNLKLANFTVKGRMVEGLVRDVWGLQQRGDNSAVLQLCCS